MMYIRAGRIACTSLALLLCAGVSGGAGAAHSVAADTAATDTPAAALPPAGTGALVVAPDLASELAKFKRVRMPFDAGALDARERRMIGKLVQACRYLDRIYW